VSKARLVITAVVVEGRPVREVSAAYGVARSWIYELLVRYHAEGEAAFEPRSRRPHSQPRAIPAATAALIIKLRYQLTRQRLDAGSHTIAWHLVEQHQLTVSEATIWRILSRAGLITPEPKKKPKSANLSFAAELPNEMWQVDLLSAHPTRRHTPRRCGDSVLPRRPFPLRPLGDLPPHRHRAGSRGRVPASRR
jgi:transposase